MAKASFKHTLFEQFAQIGKAMANANRLELLEYLAQGERSVEQLATISGLSVANTSQHLQCLRQTGLVSNRKQGLKVYYRLSGDDVVDLMTAMRAVAQRHLANVDQLVSSYLTTKDALEAVPREELLLRLEQGLVTVIDVRPAEEYAAGHLPGALNIPMQQLENSLSELAGPGEIVAYCRGPHCVLAYDAVQRLRQSGLKARRLQDGYPEWKSAGLPVEAAEQAD